MQKENVIRTIFYSKNRLFGETSTNFTNRFDYKINRVNEIAMESIDIPYTFYVINNNNNILELNGGIDTIVLTPGQYRVNSLLAEIKTQFDIIFPGQNTIANYSNQTMKITISKDVPFIIHSVDTISSSTASIPLGFNITTANDTTHEADGVVNISGTPFILVCSNFLSKYYDNKLITANNIYRTALFHIPIDVSFGGFITKRQNITIKLDRVLDIEEFTEIDIQLRDSDGNLLDLNGAEWYMHILFITS